MKLLQAQIKKALLFGYKTHWKGWLLNFKRKRYAICRRCGMEFWTFSCSFLLSWLQLQNPSLHKDNTTRDTLPVLLLPLPKPRNIRNLLRQVTLSPWDILEMFLLGLVDILHTFLLLFSVTWIKSYLDGFAGKTAAPKSVSGDDMTHPNPWASPISIKNQVKLQRTISSYKTQPTKPVLRVSFH